jgi:hypothetical protein
MKLHEQHVMHWNISQSQEILSGYKNPKKSTTPEKKHTLAGHQQIGLSGR